MSQEITDIEIFDRAMFEYLTDISPKIVYAPTNIAVQTITKNKTYADAIPYSFISYYREPDFDIDMERYNFTAASLGDIVRLREDSIAKTREARYVQNMPVNLTYQIDIWSAKAKNVQKTAIALISKLYMQNQVLIANMNPDGEPARFHFTNVDWSDNSDLEIENEKGRLYRHTIKVTIDARIKLTRDVETEKFCCVPVDIYDITNEGE